MMDDLDPRARWSDADDVCDIGCMEANRCPGHMACSECGAVMCGADMATDGERWLCPDCAIAPANPADNDAIHAIIHSALSIPGKRPNA